MLWSLFFECWVLSQLFHSPLSSSSRGSLVPLHFLPLVWFHLHIWGWWYFSRHSWFQFVIHPAWHFQWCTLHIRQISRVTIYSLVVLLSQFWTSQLFIYCPNKVLNVASGPTYRFVKNTRWSGIPTSLRIFHSLLYLSSPFFVQSVAQTAKNLPATWETWVQSLGWEDPLENEMTTHSSILLRRIPWT